MRTVEVSPDPATLPQAGRVSSVDSLPESPGYEPITMHGLWQIADAACTVINAARSHLISHPYFSLQGRGKTEAEAIQDLLDEQEAAQ